MTFLALSTKCTLSLLAMFVVHVIIAELVWNSNTKQMPNSFVFSLMGNFILFVTGVFVTTLAAIWTI